MGSVKTDPVQTIYLLCQVLFNIDYMKIENKPTFAAFLDMEKAFDRVNRDLSLLRLLEYGIDGKLYNSIKKKYV